MQTIDDFLAALAERRRLEQAAMRSTFPLPAGFQLPPELEIAAAHRWLVAPVLAQSLYAPRSAYADTPTSIRDYITYCHARWPESNWALSTGSESEVLALEIEACRAHPAILELCEEDPRWRTLRFALGARWFSLFRCREPYYGMRSRTFPGFTLHYGNPILIPSSTVSSIGTLT